MVQDDYETALTRLFQLLQQDPHYRDELPRKAMLVIFSLLGDTHELTRNFQDSMRKALH
jgi:putative thioredoxin